LKDCTLFSVLGIDLIFCVAHLAGDSLLDIVLVDLNLLAQLAWLANLMLIIFSNFRSLLGGLTRDPNERLSFFIFSGEAVGVALFWYRLYQKGAM
jgi:hypothetical protein